MEIDLGTLDRRSLYQLLISCVVPRPIALVTTLGPAGRVDIAPYSFFNVVSTSPPLVSIAVGPKKDGRKDTVLNIERNGEFVVNMVVSDMIDGMLASAQDLPAEGNKLELAKFRAAPAARVKPPRLAESPIHLECVLSKMLEVEGGTWLILGKVVHVHLRDDVLREGALDPKLVPFLCALRADHYSRIDGGFEKKRT